MKKSFFKKRLMNQSDSQPSMLSSSLKENMLKINDVFDTCDDLVVHSVQLEKKSGYLIYLQELVSIQALSNVKKELATYIVSIGEGTSNTIKSFIRNPLAMNLGNDLSSMETVIDYILTGYTVLILDGMDHAVIFNTVNETGRAVKESVTEQVVRGPREGFVENIETNLLLIRRKIRNSALKVKYLKLGKQTKTMISIVYIKGIAAEKVVAEVEQRLSQIDIDAILESHYIESLIAESRWSPFPTVYSTERPDRVTASLLEGKVAILTDGTPFVLTAPAVFVEFLHSNEDYYNGSLIATFTRWIRFLGLFITLILPAFFVAMTTFHQDLLQTPLLLRIAVSRESLPYPILVEAIFMVLTFELIREAGMRLPKSVGGAVITILGLVLLSQVAIQAGIIGPIMTVVVAVT
ncbi:MAG: spore germination protein, partial [Bacillus sp. (in: Bacteria)]|nr:spore germination protein [Bacillus sp. (in: firmicutes)]